jgi:transposase
MEQYVGLDVSLKMTAICIVDRTGKIEREGVVASDPAAIAAFVRLRACADRARNRCDINMAVDRAE